MKIGCVLLEDGLGNAVQCNGIVGVGRDDGVAKAVVCRVRQQVVEVRETPSNCRMSCPA
jgi:hypothetical protein